MSFIEDFFSCQFIVNGSGDYRQYQLNPDALVDWDLVEQVVSCRDGCSYKHQGSGIHDPTLVGTYFKAQFHY